MGRGDGEAEAVQLMAAQYSRKLHPLLYQVKDDPLYEQQRQMMLDFDSTVFPLLNAMSEHHLATPTLSYEQMHSWDALVPASGGLDNMLQIFDDVMKYEVMSRHEPFAGVAESLAAFRDAGIKVHVVSDRSPSLTDDVSSYLTHHGIEVDSVLCERKVDKVAWCKDNGVQVVIDDHPEFISRAAAEGLHVHALCFPFNQQALQQIGAPIHHDWQGVSTHLNNSYVDVISQRMRQLKQKV